MIDEHKGDGHDDHEHPHEEELELEMDTQSRIFLEMRAQNLELLKVAAQVSGYSGQGSGHPLKPADVRNAMKTIWEVYAEFYSWIDPEETGDDDEEGDD